MVGQKALHMASWGPLVWENRIIPLLTPLIDPNWINSELAIALVKIF